MRAVACLALFAAIIWAFPAGAQIGKPDAAVGRVGVLGDVSEVESRIIHNSLQSELSKSYKLVSQQEYDKAEELAFRELAADKCTEEQCIRKIQEILQVDRLFHLQIIRERGLTQVTLTLVRRSDRIVRANNCENCALAETNRVVGRLVADIVSAEIEGAPRLAETPRLAEQPRRTAPEQAPALGWWRFKWGSMLTLGVLAGAYAATEAQAVTESNRLQSTLLNEINTSTSLSQADYDAKRTQLKAEEKNAAQYKSASDAAAGASLLMLGIAAWIYFDPPAPSSASALLLPAIAPDGSRVRITYVRRW